MGNAISFRLNPKCESDRKILAWLEEKSSQPGYLNQTELIKQALLTAMEQEQRGVKEREATQWMDEAIHKAAEEFVKVVKESSQNVANNTFAGVMGAMMQQMNMGTINLMQGTQPLTGGYMNPAVIGMGASVNGMNANAPNMVPFTTETQVPDDELKADISNGMDNDTKSKLGNLFDMDDD